jgi:hypothetical protein
MTCLHARCERCELGDHVSDEKSPDRRKAANATQKADLRLTLSSSLLISPAQAEEDVVRKGIPDSLGTFAVYTFPPSEHKGDASIVDSRRIDPCFEVEGTEGTEVALGSRWFDGGHEISDPVCRCWK